MAFLEISEDNSQQVLLATYHTQRATAVYTVTRSEFQHWEDCSAVSFWLHLRLLPLLATSIFFIVLFTFNNQHFVAPICYDSLG